jgi:hypothetical protein
MFGTRIHHVQSVGPASNALVRAITLPNPLRQPGAPLAAAPGKSKTATATFVPAGGDAISPPAVFIPTPGVFRPSAAF